MRKNRFCVIIMLSLIFIFILSLKNILYGKAFSDFPTDSKVYCLNRGKAFSASDDNYTSIASFTINGKTISPSTFTPPSEYAKLLKDLKLPGNETNFYKIAYIILNIYSDKQSIGGSPNQVAIWRITSPNEPLPATSTSFISDGNELLGKATVYANWIKSFNGEPVLDSSSAVLDNGYIGPFTLTYTPKATGTYNGKTYSYGAIKMNFGGVSVSKVYTKSSGTYTEMSVNSIKSDETKFYIKKPSSVSGTSALLLITQDGPIKAEFQIYHSNDTPAHYSASITGVSGLDLRIVPETNRIFCMNCMSYHTTYDPDSNMCFFCGKARWACIHKEIAGIPSFTPSTHIYYNNLGCGLLIAKERSREKYTGILYYGGYDDYWVLAPVAFEINGKIVRQNLLQKSSASQTQYSVDTSITLIQPLELSLKKTNTIGNNLTGAEFKVKATQSVSGTTTTLYDQTIEIPKNISIAPRNTNKVTVSITETTAPDNHIGIPSSKEIVIVYEYKDSKWKVKSVTGWTGPSSNIYTSGKHKFKLVTGTASSSSCPFTISLYNRPKADFTFKKVDELTDAGIQGVKFNVKVENCENTSNQDILTDSNGNIKLEDLEFTLNGTEYKKIKITLTEKSVPLTSGYPNYKMLDGPIVVEISYVDNAPKITSCTYNGESVSSSSSPVSFNGSGVSVKAKNKPLIHLGGKVWLDVPQGTKPVVPPNGKIDSSENGIGKILIYIYKTVDGGKTYTRVYEDIDGNELMTETNSDGTYLYTNLPKIKNGNYIIFYTYEGVNYIATKDGTDQKANEQIIVKDTDTNIRTLFNNRINTINNPTSTSLAFRLVEGNIVKKTDEIYTLTYDTYTGTQGLKKSKLITTSDYNTSSHVNGTTVNREYKMYAKTKTTYNTTNLGVNFGLQQRMLDLSLQNDVYEAEVSINGRKTIYSYNEIINAGGTITINENTGENNSYTTGDYKLNLYKSDYQYSGSNPLKIYVTYAVALNNQGINNLYQDGIKAKVFSIVDYYNGNYSLLSAKYGDPLTGTDLNISSEATTRIDGVRYRKVTITSGSSNPIAEIGDGQRGIIYLKFEVNGEGSAINLGEYNNIAEIVSYGTDCGLADRDSEPANVETKGYEDDTDHAMGLNINMVKDRTISGNVWEDIKTETASDGKYKYGNGELGINIDSNGVAKAENGIKNIKVELYRIEGDSQTKVGETVQTGNNGDYSFTGFIPGDYIVKFIYDHADFNGLDYKSTIVSNEHFTNVYKGQPWYYNSIYNIAGSNSNGNIVNKAMDSALERLQLMSKYVEVNNTTYPLPDISGRISVEKMEANTPTIYVPIDVKPNDFADIDGITNVPWTISNLGISGVSFGLEKRPETKLTIEEHISRLALKGNDGVNLLHASVDSIDTLFTKGIVNLTDNMTGLKDGLKAIKTTRNNMGIWEIQTDVSELIQGAEIETEVVYQVKNESDVDYLSAAAVNSYNRNSTEEYKTYLTNVLRFPEYYRVAIIGKTYYTGQIDDTVSVVPTKVGKIQDYISDLEFRSGKGFITENSKYYNKATKEGHTAINTADYTKILDLFNGNKLMKNKTSGEIIIAIKDGEQYYKVNTSREIIKTIIKSENDIGKLEIGEHKRLNVILGINGLTPNGKLDFENYIAEIISYTTPTGRLDRNAIPGNLKDKYVYSEDSEITLEANESDEFQGERISITPPTGEDHKNIVIITSSIIAGMAVIAISVLLIKKYVIK